MQLPRTLLMCLCSVGSAALTVVVQSSAVSPGQAKSDAGSLSAQRLDLVDSKGRTRISLDADRGGAGPSIRLFGDKGDWQVDIGSTQDGKPSIALVDEAGKLGVLIAFDSKASPKIELSGQEGTLLHLGVGSTADGKKKGRLLLQDSAGTPQFER